MSIYTNAYFRALISVRNVYGCMKAMACIRKKSQKRRKGALIRKLQSINQCNIRTKARKEELFRLEFERTGTLSFRSFSKKEPRVTIRAGVCLRMHAISVSSTYCLGMCVYVLSHSVRASVCVHARPCFSFTRKRIKKNIIAIILPPFLTALPNSSGRRISLCHKNKTHSPPVLDVTSFTVFQKDLGQFYRKNTMCCSAEVYIDMRFTMNIVSRTQSQKLRIYKIYLIIVPKRQSNDSGNSEIPMRKI